MGRSSGVASARQSVHVRARPTASQGMCDTTSVSGQASSQALTVTILDTHPYFAFDGALNNAPIATGLGSWNERARGRCCARGVWPNQTYDSWAGSLNTSRIQFGVPWRGSNDCGFGAGPSWQHRGASKVCQPNILVLYLNLRVGASRRRDDLSLAGTSLPRARPTVERQFLQSGTRPKRRVWHAQSVGGVHGGLTACGMSCLAHGECGTVRAEYWRS
ncbi:hypothetical protein C8R45DRAFT_995311 [Mycena sanguinolenta]|nr:hypothetical protein C8R45DRAFT_995311 [Mycena sanguinolenta]